jgi:diadenosine tetraphosphate (Ap4A) HIT family hydrolase
MTEPYPRVGLDEQRYVAEITRDGETGRCFICEIVAGAEGHRVIYRDDVCVAFFNRYPRLVGYVLLAPLAHKTRVVDDFTVDEYLELQRRVHALGQAITKSVDTERLYVFSFGSVQAVSHVHWHLAPLPPGVPFMEQQFNAVTTPDYYDIPDTDKAALAQRIAAQLEL